MREGLPLSGFTAFRFSNAAASKLFAIVPLSTSLSTKELSSFLATMYPSVVRTYSSSGLSEIPVFAGIVHGVVVQITGAAFSSLERPSFSFASSLSSNATKIE
jgi:hypothetical protein